MAKEHFFTNSKKVFFEKPIPHGGKIRLDDLTYGVNMRSEFFRMHVVGFIPSPNYHGGLSKGHAFVFHIPINNMNFDQFKAICLSQCLRIPNFSSRVLIRDIIK